MIVGESLFWIGQGGEIGDFSSVRNEGYNFPQKVYTQMIYLIEMVVVKIYVTMYLALYVTYRTHF